jgi:hypothetical protein
MQTLDPASSLSLGLTLILAVACGVAVANIFGAWGTITGLTVGVILFDFGEQGALISNQHVIYASRPEARNRLNTVFVGGMFVVGAVGSAGASLAWELAGWPAVSGFGTAMVALGLHVHGRSLRDTRPLGYEGRIANEPTAGPSAMQAVVPPSGRPPKD